MSDTAWGLVVAIFCLGGVAGGFYGGTFADLYGRRVGMCLAAACHVAASLCFFFARSMTALLVGRLFVGLGCGASTTIVPLFLGETTPTSIKGAIGTLNQVLICVGILISQMVGIVLATPWFWRPLLALTALPALLQLTILCQAESPRYAAETGEVTPVAGTCGWDPLPLRPPQSQRGPRQRLPYISSQYTPQRAKWRCSRCLSSGTCS
mmetsp:Transcript_6921/g.21050  ORF Transcript_6921/g.21050 Transcript_6921/m.21050 type:complete len:209 (-) Transcript_6921:326-952(-)